LRIFFKLDVVAGNLGSAFRQAVRGELYQRQGFSVLVASRDRGIYFTAFDIFFDQRGGVEFVLNVFPPVP